MYEDPPNMVGILDLAREAELPEEAAARFMGDIKQYMQGIMGEILNDMDMSNEEREEHLKSLSYALESLSNEEYMLTIAKAFSGQGDLGGVEDFINTSFELPDLQGTSQKIYDEVTQYLRENLPKLTREDDSGSEVEVLSEAQVDAVIASVQEELRAERGPDFYKLPVLFKELGMPVET